MAKTKDKKSIFTPESQRTLVLVAGILGIVVITNWQTVSNFFSKPTPATVILDTPATQDKLVIPSLNIDAPIVYSTQTDEDKIQNDLTNGVVHLSGSAAPGTEGNAYIVGHSSNYKNAPGSYNQVFANLPNIQVGAQIVITSNLKHYTYVVYETRIVEPTELWVTSQITNGGKILTLQTSYPVGTAKERFIAIARLAQ